jgi:bla regulator protein blaR1
MRFFDPFFSLTHALGWALINSLWQAFLIAAFVMIFLRWIPSRRSQLRYGIACTGLALTVLMSISTFVYVKRTSSQEVARHSFVFQNTVIEREKIQETIFSLRELSEWVQTALQANMSIILFAWCLGAMLFILRMISGWWYISRLQTEAIPITGEWNARLQHLAQHLHINRLVRLAQSARIHTPLVIGFLKPIVLIPSGMISGLSVEQIETIFIHELAHIRRHDYLINLIQSFVEALFFFNPFVWIISGIIRREREYCCDDVVLTKGNPIAYAHALTRLEEERLSKAMFTLALAENKNQLLNRIKRIMEKSAKNYSGRDRLIPALLLVIGLICASWLTIQTDRSHTPQKKILLASDTSRKPLMTKRSKTTTITFDEKGEPHEEVIEEFSSDADFDFDLPAIALDMDMPDLPSIIPVIPNISAFDMPIPAMPGIPELESFDLSLQHSGFDTIPRTFHFKNDINWEEFSREFEEKFREHFDTFYEKNEKEFEEMMKEFEQDFAERSNVRELNMVVLEKPNIEQLHEQLEKLQHFNTHQLEDATKQAQEVLKQLNEHSKELNLRAQKMRGINNEMESFKSELKELLIEDGYIEKQDEIKNINWDDDGEIEVNDKKIKDSDRQKYNDLHRKYFKSRHFRYVD